jgi:serine/threonine-protein kinase ULK/ATG1
MGYKTLYQNNIIHRDIKPANILVSNESDLIIKITDFGMGRMIEDV